MPNTPENSLKTGSVPLERVRNHIISDFMSDDEFQNLLLQAHFISNLEAAYRSSYVDAQVFGYALLYKHDYNFEKAKTELIEIIRHETALQSQHLKVREIPDPNETHEAPTLEANTTIEVAAAA